ncbi:helix-turn-helix transcriptional regulator [Nocardia sp. CDC153]|uniref:helix-turn-helix domain-containing protein n=1 Tax=Nocardia sp. CDC153 TaxID=3112167 RepID=UPI002DBFBDAE|nr:helix-turn-helix transcriptional regulator [Nocardia sp. CDC153]MEC3952638.1 helix-turn-helix transcriptional regulator [Nocardia sp. CDC153]
MSSDELKLPLPSLGDYVEFHRKRLGLTREALGQRAFLSARTIQKLERGEQIGLSRPTQESLGRALGLTTADEFRHLDDLTRVHLPRRAANTFTAVVRPYSGPVQCVDPI